MEIICIWQSDYQRGGVIIFNYKKYEIQELADKYEYRKESLEKVLRLIDILNFIYNHIFLKDKLVLKGGTAINFTIFNLKRLSVDIDLDYNINNTKEDMLEERAKILTIIENYMYDNNYIKNNSSKASFALDSYVFSYNNRFRY